MSIVRWAPSAELQEMQDSVNRLFAGVFHPAYRRDDELTSRGWRPSVDIFETEKEVVIKAELPEVSEKDVTVGIEDNILTIEGERKFDTEVKEENYHRIERSYGSFARSFTLPHTVDREKIKATFRDGVLKIALPKREETRPKQIKITTN